MKIQLSFTEWSDHEDPRGYQERSWDKVVPLELGCVEECPLFKVVEIKEHSALIAKRDGSHVSLGLDSEWPKDLYNDGFCEPVELTPGGRGLTVSASTSYNGTSYGSSTFLYLIDE